MCGSIKNDTTAKGNAMRKPAYTYQYGCAVEATADIIGGKWKAVILYYLFQGSQTLQRTQATLA
jgi:DNA-binding HxlR family transcriptional regulator